MQNVLDLLVNLTGIATLGQYAWSMRNHFHSQQMPSGAKIISTVVTASGLFFLVLIWLTDQPIAALAAGFALQLASLALFWAAIRASRAARLRFAFDEENPDSLVVTGPYRYVRHPFYTSYILFWAGWGLATWSIWAIVPVAGIVVIYVIAARDEEAKFSRTAMGPRYEEYRRNTGLFWPMPGRSVGGPGG
jgi:protein-S-isoprenylcysteine O-methyltransferase Ste14